MLLRFKERVWKNDVTSDVHGQSFLEIMQEQYVIFVWADEMNSHQLAFSFFEISERYLAGRLSENQGYSHCSSRNFILYSLVVLKNITLKPASS